MQNLFKPSETVACIEQKYVGKTYKVQGKAFTEPFTKEKIKSLFDVYQEALDQVFGGRAIVMQRTRAIKGGTVVPSTSYEYVYKNKQSISSYVNEGYYAVTINGYRISDILDSGLHMFYDSVSGAKKIIDGIRLTLDTDVEETKAILEKFFFNSGMQNFDAFLTAIMNTGKMDVYHFDVCASYLCSFGEPLPAIGSCTEIQIMNRRAQDDGLAVDELDLDGWKDDKTRDPVKRRANFLEYYDTAAKYDFDGPVPADDNDDDDCTEYVKQDPEEKCEFVKGEDGPQLKWDDRPRCDRCKTSKDGCEFYDGGFCRGVCYPTYPPQYRKCLFERNDNGQQYYTDDEINNIHRKCDPAYTCKNDCEYKDTSENSDFAKKEGDCLDEIRKDVDEDKNCKDESVQEKPKDDEYVNLSTASDGNNYTYSITWEDKDGKPHNKTFYGEAAKKMMTQHKDAPDKKLREVNLDTNLRDLFADYEKRLRRLENGYPKGGKTEKPNPTNHVDSFDDFFKPVPFPHRRPFNLAGLLSGWDDLFGGF